MLKLAGTTAEQFLERHWQKSALFMPQAMERVRPAVTRNELGWLATLDDVESRLVFTERAGERVRYRATTGPFDPDYLAALPKRDWTLLVHDVEKHVPALRRLFDHVPFIPDWRIDDLMVSFAAPGGGVGPHRDNYDVFLCQGIGIRKWHVAADDVPDDPAASDDLALTASFTGHTHTVRQGDVLYLPPGVAHWGTATRACMTYSIGMRAPQLSDLLTGLPDTEQSNPFYTDPDLAINEAIPGFISARAVDRLLRLIDKPSGDRGLLAESLGRYVTQTKDWITPERPGSGETDAILEAVASGMKLGVHGMTRIAWDERNLYVNGACMSRNGIASAWLESLCASRKISAQHTVSAATFACLKWMLKQGTFELPEK